MSFIFRFNSLFNIYIFCLVVCFKLNSQSQLTWFDPSAELSSDKIFLDKAGDCLLIKDGFDQSLQTDVIEFEWRPLFFYTHEDYKQWLETRALIETKAKIYKADKSTFVLMEIKINSQNAKQSYGGLEFRAKLKCFLVNGEFVYLENVERTRGRTNRKENYTLYEPVFALENYEMRALKKHGINKIGLIWEEGYQEYEIQNIDLLKNQINCLID